MRFGYDAALLERCPELVAGVVWVDGLAAGPAPPEVAELLAAAVAAVRAAIAAPPEIARLPSIAAWRLVYSRFGVKPNRYPCAAEALVRRVVETGDVPRIGALVDLCNAASLRHGIPVAPFDLRAVVGDTLLVRLAAGNETWRGSSTADAEPVPAGEVVYADAGSEVLSRRWNWRQADKGKIAADTTQVVITTEAVHAESAAAVAGVLADLTAYLPNIAARVDKDILGAGQPWSVRPV